MMLGLGDKSGIDIENVEKSRDEYRSESYIETKLPVAPTIMIDEDVIEARNNITLSPYGMLVGPNQLIGTECLSDQIN